MAAVLEPLPMPVQPFSTGPYAADQIHENPRNHVGNGSTLSNGAYGAHSVKMAQEKPRTSYEARRKRAAVMKSNGAWIVEHQLGLSITPLLTLFAAHICFPSLQKHTQRFFLLSYYDATSGKYGLGLNDLFFVLYWIVLFTGLRVGVMGYVLEPLGRWGGIKKRRMRVRFAEQAWLFLYYVVFWSLGMYLYYNSRYWLSLEELWLGWPIRKLDGLMKQYYLVQFAFWVQQILVVNIEERRKDYHQMLTHHVITCMLIFTSYGQHQTRVGNVILCLMDVVDILFPLAKMLKYLHFHLACDIAFLVFMLTWFVARHMLYPIVWRSVCTDLNRIVPYSCYGADGHRVDESSTAVPSPGSLSHLYRAYHDPAGVICFNRRVKWTFISTLLALQVISIIWFGMILRVAWRVLKGGKAEDSRSDNEEGDDEEDDEAEEVELEAPGAVVHGGDARKVAGPSIEAARPPIEEQVGVDGLNLKSRRSRRYGSSSSSGVGVTLPGNHRDRKELLGRIGCDKSG